MSAKLIMFDGPDGVGKSTQIKQVASALTARNLRVLVTRINGGSPIGEALRTVYLSNVERPASTDYYLGMAIFEAFVEETEHQRADYDVILVDRSPLSNVAYQSFGSGYPLERSLAGCSETLSKLQPDLIICYSAPLAVLRERLRHATKAKVDYFESKPDTFFKKVIEGYEFCAKEYKTTVIDATPEAEVVQRRTLETVLKVL